MGAECSAPERSSSLNSSVCPDPSSQIAKSSNSIEGPPSTSSSRRYSLSSLRRQSASGPAETSRSETAKTTVWGITAREGKGYLQKSEAPSWLRAWAASIAPAKADMDRFALCLRDGKKGRIISAAICDGHGISRQHNWGGELATKAVTTLVQQCAYFPEEALTRLSNTSKESTELQIATNPGSIMTQVFESFQTQHEAIYNKEILGPVEEARKAFEAEHGFSAGPCTLPCEGGTTATVIRLDGSQLTLAWVGDSRAVLAVRRPHADENNKNTYIFEAIPLSTDHNIERNKKEQERCQAAGGQVLGRFLGAGDADGMLQVTRSLGDTAHHASNVVLATPEIAMRELNENDAFILIASDGVWDFFDNQTAINTIVDHLQEADPSILSKPTTTEQDIKSQLARSNAQQKFNADSLVPESTDEKTNIQTSPTPAAAAAATATSNDNNTPSASKSSSFGRNFPVSTLRRLSASSATVTNDHSHLQSAVKALVDKVLAKASEQNSKPDDTACLVLLLSPPPSSSDPN